MTAKKIALFIDADNVSAKFGKQIIETLERRGEIFIRRIFGNWEKNSLHGWNDCIRNFSLRAVQQPDFVAGKNATDLSLTIDAMDVLHEGKAEIFALVSNDSDFTPLAIRLREGGMTIIGFGNANAAVTFRAACNEFVDLDACAEVKISPPVEKKISPSTAKNLPVQMSLFDEENISPPPTSSKVISIDDRKLQSDRDKKIRQLHDILHDVATSLGDANGFFLLNSAGQAIKRKKLGFGVRDCGFGTLRNFVEAFPKFYEVQRQGRTFCCRCLSVEKNLSDTEEKLRQIHSALRETATTYKDLNDKGDFTALNRAGQSLSEKKLSFKGLGYGSLSKLVAGFPKLYEIRKLGTSYYYRCR